MIATTINIESVKKIKAAMRLFVDGFGEDSVQVLKDTAKKFAILAIDATPPFGDGAAPKKLGELRVKSDLIRAITPFSVMMKEESTDERLQKRLKQVVRQKDKAALQSILENIPKLKSWKVRDFDKSIHTDNRTRGGRYRFPESQKIVTLEQQEHKSYERYLTKLIGYRKSGWAKIAAQLGGKTKGWIARHIPYANAGVLDRTKEKNPSLILINRTPTISRFEGLYKDTLDSLAVRMFKDIAFKMKYNARKQKLAKS